jgi:hypothetical protein
LKDIFLENKCEVTNSSQERSLTERGLKEEYLREKNPEREASKRRILWRDLTEKKLRWSAQKKHGPSVQTYRAPEEL